MADKQEVGIEPNPNGSLDLPDVVASMEMLTVDTADGKIAAVSNTQRYGMRKRLPKGTPTDGLNRRCSQRPKKRSYSSMETDDEVKEYYLDRHVKRKPNTLETIYEEIEGMSENSTTISGRKLRRLIEFAGDSKSDDAKIKKRKAKIKRVFGSKFKPKCSISMQKLVKKLRGIRPEAPTSPDKQYYEFSSLTYNNFMIDKD